MGTLTKAAVKVGPTFYRSDVSSAAAGAAMIKVDESVIIPEINLLVFPFPEFQLFVFIFQVFFDILHDVLHEVVYYVSICSTF